MISDEQVTEVLRLTGEFFRQSIRRRESDLAVGEGALLGILRMRGETTAGELGGDRGGGSEKFLKNRVMALSEELPLYRDTYRLLNNLLILTQDFPRFFRYSMGSRMVDLTLDMLSLIYKANSSYEKVGVLTEFLDRYRMLQMLFRVCVEQKVITERKYASFGLLLEKIGKQATSWKQYNERGMKKQEDKRQ